MRQLALFYCPDNGDSNRFAPSARWVSPVADCIDPEDGIECYECNNSFVEADIIEGPDGENYCGDCHCEAFTACHSCDDFISNDDTIGGPDGESYCESCHDSEFSFCSGCEEYHSSEDINEISYRTWRGWQNEVLCDSCASEHYSRCADCNDWVRTDGDGEYGNDCSGDVVCYSCSDNYFYCDGCDSTCTSDSYGEDGRCSDCTEPEEDEDDESELEEEDCEEYAGSTDLAGSSRSFGVELEIAHCKGYMDRPKANGFIAKNDGSVPGGKEFVSKVCRGDDGLKDVKDFCTHAKRAGWKVNTNCGFHAHFGVSDLSDEQKRAVAIAYRMTQEVWFGFVRDSRKSNTYCKESRWEVADVLHAADFARFAGSQDRYQWLNLRSLDEHGTFEVRLHHPTVDGNSVTNWVAANIRFIDAVAKMTVTEVIALFENESVDGMFTIIRCLWDCADLSAYYENRARRYGEALVA